MIHWDDRGAQTWNGVHVTHTTTVAELVDIDNLVWCLVNSWCLW